MRALSKSLFLQRSKSRRVVAAGCPRQRLEASVNASEPCSCSALQQPPLRSQAFILHLRNQNVNFAHKSLMCSIARRKAAVNPHSEKKKQRRR